jgi:hypothetical protein
MALHSLLLEVLEVTKRTLSFTHQVAVLILSSFF